MNQAFPDIMKDVAKLTGDFKSGDYVTGHTLIQASDSKKGSMMYKVLKTIEKIYVYKDENYIKLKIKTWGQNEQSIQLTDRFNAYIEYDAIIKVSKYDLKNGDNKVTLWTTGIEGPGGADITKIKLSRKILSIKYGGVPIPIPLGRKIGI